METTPTQSNSAPSVQISQEVLNKVRNAVINKQWDEAASTMVTFAHSQLPPNDPIHQLYNGSSILSGGAAEAKQQSEEFQAYLALHLEFMTLIDAEFLKQKRVNPEVVIEPDASHIAARALFDYINELDDRFPGVLAEAVKRVRTATEAKNGKLDY